MLAFKKSSFQLFVVSIFRRSVNIQVGKGLLKGGGEEGGQASIVVSEFVGGEELSCF